MNRFEKWSVWTSTVLVTVSGIGYLWMKHFMEPAGQFAVVSHPLEPWFLRAHVLSAPLFVFAMGQIMVRHVWRHLRDGIRRARKSGLAGVVTVLVMVTSGYLLQVVTGEAWLDALVIVHIVSSFLFVGALAAHQWATRRPPSVGVAAEDPPVRAHTDAPLPVARERSSVSAVSPSGSPVSERPRRGHPDTPTG